MTPGYVPLTNNGHTKRLIDCTAEDAEEEKQRTHERILAIEEHVLYMTDLLEHALKLEYMRARV